MNNKLTKTNIEIKCIGYDEQFNVIACDIPFTYYELLIIINAPMFKT